MHRLARLTSDERRHMVADFIAGLSTDTARARSGAAALRATLPDLPDEPGLPLRGASAHTRARNESASGPAEADPDAVQRVRGRTPAREP